MSLNSSMFMLLNGILRSDKGGEETKTHPYAACKVEWRLLFRNVLMALLNRFVGAFEPFV